MYKILVARPSVHISYGIGETQRKQSSDHLNTGDTDSNSSDGLVPLLVELSDGAGAALVGDVDGAAASDDVSEGACGRAAGVRQGDGGVVLGTVLTAAGELLLEVVDDSVGGLVDISTGSLVEERVDRPYEPVPDGVSVCEQENSDHHLYDDNHQQEDGVRDNHAVTFPNRSATPEECYHEHNGSDYDEHPWCDRQVCLELIFHNRPVELERDSDAYHG